MNIVHKGRNLRFIVVPFFVLDLKRFLKPLRSDIPIIPKGGDGLWGYEYADLKIKFNL